MFTNDESINQETTNPALTMTPEAVVEGLRVMRASIGEVTPLTARQRKAVRDSMRTTNPVLQASINVLGALDNVSQAIGQPVAEVRQLDDECNRWTAVEDELRALLSGVSGANLLRRQRVALRAAQALGIGAQLARDPAHAVLVPHLEEVKRLKSFKRRKKATQAPGTPAPAAPMPEDPGKSGNPQP